MPWAKLIMGQHSQAVAKAGHPDAHRDCMTYVASLIRTIAVDILILHANIHSDFPNQEVVCGVFIWAAPPNHANC